MPKKSNKLATPEEMENLQDLPALESVTTDRGLLLPLLVFGAFSLFYTTVVVWCYLRLREFLDDSGKIMVGAVVLSAIWVLGRVAFDYSSFKTNRSGLTLKGPMRRRFISWTEIKKARTTVTRSGNFCVKLDTAHGQISILPRGFGLSTSSADGVIASIWQYLRQMGCAEGMLIPKTALSFWEPVPDDVPEEMDWGKPPTRRNTASMVVVIVFCVAIPGCLWGIEIPRSFSRLAIYLLLSLCWLMMLKTLMIPEITRFAYVVNVRRSYLECTLLWSKVNIPWSDVASAALRANYLIIRAKDRREVWIRYKPGDKYSENLIFAIIRQLRTAVMSQVIALPERISANPEVLNRKTYSSEQQIALQRAFLNTLEENARRKIQWLWCLNISLFLIGMIFGFTLGIWDVVGDLARSVHSGASNGTRYFIMMDTMFYGCIWMMIFMVGGYLLGERLGFRLAGPYKEEWRRFLKVGNGSGKLGRVLNYVFITIGVISFLTVPLVIDCYTRVTDKGFAVNHFFELRERVYPWDQVQAVEEQIVSNVGSKSGSKSTFIIKFADGYHWRMKEGSVRADRHNELRQAVEFVAKKSGKQIVWR